MSKEKEFMNDITSKAELTVKPTDIAMLLYDIYDVPSGICEQIKDMVQRLESIDNSEPSEALECLEEMWELSCDSRKPEYTLYDTIKQALLKEQEPKNYLKWEDLEFKEDNEAKIKVRMGEHIYDLWYGSYKTGYGIFKQKCSLAGYEFDEDYDIDIFNDLHLERVE